MTLEINPIAGTRDIPRKPIALMGLLVIATVFGVALIKQLRLPFNASPVDIVMAVIIMARAPALSRWVGSSGATLRRILPFVWLFVLGTLISLFTAGINADIIMTVTKNALPFLAFFALWSVLEERPRLLPIAHWSYIGASFVVVVTVLTDTSYRAGGVLNANYAAHFLGIGILLALALPILLVFRLVLIAPMLLGILQTGSFGGLAMLSGFVAYWLWTRKDLITGNSRFLLRALIVLLIVIVVPIAEARLASDGLGVGSGFEASRYERSSNGRLEMYERGLQSAVQNPWGVGPGQYEDDFSTSATPEMHNDGLSFLLENGLIGFVGIVGIIWNIGRSAPQGGLTRILLTGLILTSLSRQTWNFRHAWVALAIVIVLDQTQRIGQKLGSSSASTS